MTRLLAAAAALFVAAALIAQRGEIVKQRAENERLRTDRRERIATAALPGLLSKWGGTPQQAADFAIQYADDLIAKLDKEDGKP